LTLEGESVKTWRPYLETRIYNW